MLTRIADKMARPINLKKGFNKVVDQGMFSEFASEI